jgi:YD repeat-containing protein
MIVQKNFARQRLLWPMFVVVLSILCFYGISAQAQDIWPNNEESNLSSKEEALETVGSDSFGDTTDQYSGVTTFTVTDVDIPGNGGLPVTLQRTLRAFDNGLYTPGSLINLAWTRYDVPYLSGVFKLNAGWKAANGYVATDLRCTYGGAPQVSQSSGKEYTFEEWDYHHGIRLNVPGQGSQPIAFPPVMDPNTVPSTGGPYARVSKEFWYFTCLPSTSNGVAGEGFLARAPDGKKYYFDRIVKADRLTGIKMAHTLGLSVLSRSEYRALVSRVEDQYGNWVTYGYSDVADLTSITASDGRSLTLTYVSPGGALASVTDGARTWTYSYANGVEVAHPDGTVWRSSISGAGLTYNQSQQCTDRNSRYGGEAIVAIQLRSGATGAFTFRPVRRGLSYVNWGAFVAEYCQHNTIYLDNVGLYSKAIPGVSWTYIYGPDNGCYTNGGSPACNSSSAQTIQTEIRRSDSTFTRYTFGNRRDDTEARLDSVELGSLSTGTDRSTVFSWQTFNTIYAGASSYVDGIARVVATESVTQDGATYNASHSNWDAFRKPQTVVESGPNGGSRTTQFTYYNDRASWVVGQTATITAGNNHVSKTYNANAGLQSETGNGVTTSYTYTSQGDIASVTHPRSLTHSFTNYKRGIAQNETQPEGVSISRVVNDAGYVTSETNGEGYTTGYGRDAAGRLTSINYPGGDDATIVYSGATKATRTMTRGSLVQTTTRDGLWRPILIETAGITVTKQYDADSRLTFESSPNASGGTQTVYDSLGRLTRVTYPDGNYRSVAYGAATITKTDERGKGTTYTYRGYGDPDNLVLMSIDAPVPSASVSFVRDTEDLITSVTQGGFTRSFGYDSRKYQTSETSPEAGTVTFGRDDAGNMTSRTVGTAQTIYAYDGQNRLTGITFPSASTPSVTNTYNTLGRLLTASSSAAARSFQYDENGNLTNETVAVDGHSFSVEYAYNGLDQLDSITYPRSGAVVSYAPNALGRPTQVSGYVNNVSYYPSGQVSQMVYANGATSTYGQNARLWPSSFAAQRGGAFYVLSDYGYDPVGNLTTIDDAADGSYARTMTYDDINRVVSSGGPWGGGNIAYDGAGNITSQIFGSYGIVYSYDTSNRLSGLTGNRTASYSYDAYGNITNDSIKAYTYDDKPHLRCVNCANPAAKVEYGYDATDRRVWSIKGGVKTYEIYNSHGNLLIEFTPSYSNKLVEYIYLGTRRVAQRETQ